MNLICLKNQLPVSGESETDKFWGKLSNVQIGKHEWSRTIVLYILLRCNLL